VVYLLHEYPGRRAERGRGFGMGRGSLEGDCKGVLFFPFLSKSLFSL